MSRVNAWKGGSNMANEPILAVEANIDDQIIQFCRARPGLTEEQVVRDIVRIVCIVNLVHNGTLDGKNTVLCGGMAMRCLDSPRMSVFDGDTASRSEPDPEVLRDAISYEDPDEILAEKIVAWWLFGHAKHYNDIAFLAGAWCTKATVTASRR